MVKAPPRNFGSPRVSAKPIPRGHRAWAHRRRQVRIPQKNPGLAPPVASGIAGSGLRPAHDGGTRRPPCHLRGLSASVVVSIYLIAKRYENLQRLQDGFALLLVLGFTDEVFVAE